MRKRKRKNINVFLRGLLSAFNIGGEHIFFKYDSEKTPAEIDIEAIWSDWNEVGKDLQSSIMNLIVELEDQNSLTIENTNQLHLHLKQLLNAQKEKKSTEKRYLSDVTRPI